MFALTLRSRNTKTGPIPVSTSSRLALSCPVQQRQCRRLLRRVGAVGAVLGKVSDGRAAAPMTRSWRLLPRCRPANFGGMTKPATYPAPATRSMPACWRSLSTANAGRRGFTYSHKPLTPDNAAAIAAANAGGFTINLSANTLAHADELADAAVGPVVAVLPLDYARKETRAGKTYHVGRNARRIPGAGSTVTLADAGRPADSGMSRGLSRYQLRQLRPLPASKPKIIISSRPRQRQAARRCDRARLAPGTDSDSARPLRRAFFVCARWGVSGASRIWSNGARMMGSLMGIAPIAVR